MRTGLLLREQPCQKRVLLAEVGDDDVGAGLDEPLALRLVDTVATHFVGGYTDGNAADALGILDLDVAVAEGQEVATGRLVILDDTVDEDFAWRSACNRRWRRRCRR